MSYSFKNGQTSIIVRVKLLNTTTGQGFTGLTSTSTGLIISTIADVEAAATAYTQAGSTIETVTTLGTYAAPTATKCRFKEVDATNHKGLYEIQIADARYAVSNAKSITISLSGVANLQEGDIHVQLTADDPYVAKPANSSLQVIDGSGRVDVSKIAGVSQSARDIGASVLLSAGTGAGQVDMTSGVIKANLAQILGTALTETSGQIAAAFKQFFNIASPTSTMNLVTGVTNLTNAPTVGDFNATMKTSLNAATPVASLSGDLTPTMKASVTTAATAATPTAAAVTGLNPAFLDVAVSTRSTFAGGAVSSVSGNVGGVVGVTFPGTVAGSSDVTAILAAIATRLAASSYTTPDNAGIAAIYSGLSVVDGHVLGVPSATWDVTLSGHQITGTTGAALAAAGGSGDPWATALPGSYAAGTAGYVVGHNIDAQISTRLPTSSYTAPDNTTISDISGRVPAALVGGRMDVSVGAMAANVITAAATASDFVTETAAGVWAYVIEGAFTAVQVMRLVGAAAAAKMSGLATSSVVIRDLSDTKNRISATVDADGNRLTVTRDVS